MLVDKTHQLRLERCMSSYAAKVLGKNVLRLREEQGLTQAALAKRAGVDGSQIAHIEKGASFAGGKAFDRLAAALGVTLAELLDETGMPRPKTPTTPEPKPPTLAEAVRVVNENIEQLVLKKRSKKKTG